MNSGIAENCQLMYVHRSGVSCGDLRHVLMAQWQSTVSAPTEFHTLRVGYGARSPGILTALNGGWGNYEASSDLGSGFLGAK